LFTPNTNHPRMKGIQVYSNERSFSLYDRLIIYSFTSRSRIFHLYGDVTITGERLQNLGPCSAHRAFEQAGRVTPSVTRDLGFSGIIRRSAPINRLLRFACGCEGPILTRILTGFMLPSKGKIITKIQG
jgi:hypothetical protein